MRPSQLLGPVGEARGPQRWEDLGLLTGPECGTVVLKTPLNEAGLCRGSESPGGDRPGRPDPLSWAGRTGRSHPAPRGPRVGGRARDATGERGAGDLRDARPKATQGTPALAAAPKSRWQSTSLAAGSGLRLRVTPSLRADGPASQRSVSKAGFGHFPHWEKPRAPYRQGDGARITGLDGKSPALDLSVSSVHAPSAPVWSEVGRGHGRRCFSQP